MNFDNSSAPWRETELRDILVRRMADQDHEAATAGEIRQAAPEPRTFMQMAEEEMRAMADACALTENFKADSHVIASRAAQRFPGRPRCAKTIRNQLCKVYRDLCKAQRAQNNSGDF